MNLNFQLAELEKQFYNERLRFDPSFARFISTSPENNKTKAFIEMIRTNKKRGRNQILEFYGPTGSTKSYCGMTTGNIIDPNFGELSKDGLPRKIFFEQSLFNDDMRNFHEDDCIELDEQVEEYGIGKTREAAQLGNFCETIRKKRISFIRCSPIRKDTISRALSHWIIECMPGFVDAENNIVKAALQTNGGLTLGYLYFSHPETKLGKKFVEAYEKKKDIFLGKIQGIGGTSSIDVRARKVYESDEFKKYLNSVAKLTNDDIYAFVDETFPELKMNLEHFMISRKVRVLIKRKNPEKLYGVLMPGEKQVDSAGNVLNEG
jgi:hypothetical protein